MRDIIIISVIVALMVACSVWTHGFYEDTMNEFDEKLNSLASTIDTASNKEEKINEIEKTWNEKEKILIIFQDHDSIDDIEEKLYECFHYYRTNQKERMELSKEKMISNIEDLKKREELTVVNIF